MIKPVLTGILLLLSILSTNVYAYSGGSGTQADPYRIANHADLMLLGADTSNYHKYFVLTANIDLDPAITGTAPFTRALIASSSTQYIFTGRAFNGNLDGKGYSISNLTVAAPGGGFAGLFGKIDAGGSVSNIKLIDCDINGYQNVGGLCGENDGSINNCHVSGRVWNTEASINMGGLCGINNGTITTSSSTASLDGNSQIGGLCGTSNGSIFACYATGNISGQEDSSMLGGLCGFNTGPISNCYATGSITAGTEALQIGGLSGCNSRATVTNCFATGAIPDNDLCGGLFGDTVSGQAVNCYWNRDSSGMLYNDGGKSLSAAQMKSESSFIGLDNGLWVIDNGNDHPHLVYEGTPGAVIDYSYPCSYAGTGVDENDPFVLTNAADMVCMSRRPTDWSGYFILAGDIDMSGVSDWTPPLGFSGILNAQGFTVSNLLIDPNEIGNHSSLGLFARLNPNSVVTNLKIDSIAVKALDGSEKLGGITGENYGKIANCSVTGQIGSNGALYVGGVCGINYGSIERSMSSATVRATRIAGGLCGKNKGTIANSYSNQAVFAQKNTAGGLCGRNLGDITNSYANVNVSGFNILGGLCGSNIRQVNNSYAIGPVNGDERIGGLFGSNYTSGNVSSCLWDIDTSGHNDGIGFDEGTVTDLLGRSTAQMATQSTYTAAGWEFVSSDPASAAAPWRMCVDGIDYPKHSFQSAKGDFICPAGISLNDFAALASGWLTDAQNPSWNPALNLVDPYTIEVIDIYDLQEFIKNWLQ